MRSVFSNALSFVPVAIVAAISMGCQHSVGPKVGVVRFQDGSCLTSGSIEFRNIANGMCFASRVNNRGVFYPADINGIIGLPAGMYEVVVGVMAGADMLYFLRPVVVISRVPHLRL